MRACAFPQKAVMASIFPFPTSKSSKSFATRSPRSLFLTATQSIWARCRTSRENSINASVPGRTPSERAVIPAFEEIFAEARGRIIVAAFASSIHRLQIVFDIALQFNRRVCVLGRSMQKNVEIADRLGYLDIHDGLLGGV